VGDWQLVHRRSSRPKTTGPGPLKRRDGGRRPSIATPVIDAEATHSSDEAVGCLDPKPGIEVRCGWGSARVVVYCLAPEDGQGSGSDRQPRISRPLFGIRRKASKGLNRRCWVLKNPHSWVPCPSGRRPGVGLEDDHGRSACSRGAAVKLHVEITSRS
jgi:hypothetical protein